jgi:acyl carrier protein
MELDQFIEYFSDLFDETDSDTIVATTQFKDLEEWSSLVALSVIAMIDEEYDVEFRGDDIRNSTTVEDLYNTVLQRLEEEEE